MIKNLLRPFTATLLALVALAETSFMFASPCPKEANNVFFDFTKADYISSGERKMLIDMEKEGGSALWLKKHTEENVPLEKCPPGFRCCCLVWNLGNVDRQPGLSTSQIELIKNHNLEILKTLAESGYMPAHAYLADCYDTRGEPSKALYWYVSGAELGCDASMHQLSLKYAKGTGVVQDTAESIKWLFLASAKGDPKASEKINSLKSSIGDQKDFKDGKNRASQWQNSHPRAFISPE